MAIALLKVSTIFVFSTYATSHFSILVFHCRGNLLHFYARRVSVDFSITSSF